MQAMNMTPTPVGPHLAKNTLTVKSVTRHKMKQATADTIRMQQQLVDILRAVMQNLIALFYLPMVKIPTGILRHLVFMVFHKTDMFGGEILTCTKLLIS